MRNKLREMKNREEGFTLVELLAVIVILGIIVAIAIPSIGTLIDNAGTEARNAEKTLIVDAARLWEIEDDNNLVKTDEPGPNVGTSVQTLITAGFLDLRSSDINPDTSFVYRDSDNGDQISVYIPD